MLCGITQNPKTKSYMMVLNEKCKRCNYICNAIHFQQNFGNWTSGSDDLDKFIQDTQLSAHNTTEEVLEWIPYDRFYNIKCIAEKKVYKANWVDGSINYRIHNSQNWQRVDQNMIVSLKRLNNLENVTLEITKEV
jgi:hypothetical protein